MAKRTFNSAEDIAQAVQRYKAGETVRVLAQFYKVAVPTVYVWIRNHESAKEVAPERRECQKVAMLENALEKLKAENVCLKAKMFDYMIASGRI